MRLKYYYFNNILMSGKVNTQTRLSRCQWAKYFGAYSNNSFIFFFPFRRLASSVFFCFVVPPPLPEIRCNQKIVDHRLTYIYLYTGWFFVTSKTIFDVVLNDQQVAPVRLIRILNKTRLWNCSSCVLNFIIIYFRVITTALTSRIPTFVSNY